MLVQPGPFSDLPTTKEARCTPMIRGFGLFCKINFNHYSALDLFSCSMNMIKIHDHPCPTCGARHPGWKRHAAYDRYLIGFDEGAVCSHSVVVTRFMCQSCRSTHALLPEFVIPFKSHSLLFVLAVLKDYFLSHLTVGQLCAKYEITPATLYSWKAAFLKDKRLWLGALQDSLTSAAKFLAFLSKEGLEHHLDEFFAITNRSLLQTRITIRGNGMFAPD